MRKLDRFIHPKSLAIRAFWVNVMGVVTPITSVSRAQGWSGVVAEVDDSLYRSGVYSFHRMKHPYIVRLLFLLPTHNEPGSQAQLEVQPIRFDTYNQPAINTYLALR